MSSAPDSAPVPPPDPTARSTVLLVEDDPGDVLMISEALDSAEGTRDLHVVGNGQAALDFLRHHGEYAHAPRPDLVLLDLNMPGIDGREVLIAIKTDRDLRLIPVVVLTTSSDDVDVNTSYLMQANAYVTKPLELDALTSAVRQVDRFFTTLARRPEAGLSSS